MQFGSEAVTVEEVRTPPHCPRRRGKRVEESSHWPLSASSVTSSLTAPVRQEETERAAQQRRTPLLPCRSSPCSGRAWTPTPLFSTTAPQLAPLASDALLSPLNFADTPTPPLEPCRDACDTSPSTATSWTPCVTRSLQSHTRPFSPSEPQQSIATPSPPYTAPTAVLSHPLAPPLHPAHGTPTLGYKTPPRTVPPHHAITLSLTPHTHSAPPGGRSCCLAASAVPELPRSSPEHKGGCRSRPGRDSPPLSLLWPASSPPLSPPSPAVVFPCFMH